MVTSAETKWHQFWKRIDSFGRFLQHCIGIAILTIAVLALGGAAVVGVFKYFRGLGWQRSLIELSATFIGFGVLYLGRRSLGSWARKATVVTLRFLYYGTATVFYVSVLATVLAVLSSIESGLTSFLTAPIGLKPPTGSTGLGEFFLEFVAIMAISGILYATGRYYKDEVRTLLTVAPTSADSRLESR